MNCINSNNTVDDFSVNVNNRFLSVSASSETLANTGG